MILQHITVSRQPCPSAMVRNTGTAHSLPSAIPVLHLPSSTACSGKRGMLGLELGGQLSPSKTHSCGGVSPSRGGMYRQNKVACQAAGTQAAVHPSEEEARAKQRFLAQAVDGSGAQGVLKSALDAAIALLEDAASTRQVDQELVLGALLHVEESTLQGTVKLQDVLPDLEGKWRLVFSSGTVSFLRYIPVKEYVAIAIALQSIDLSSDIGPLYTRFSGKFSWRAPADMDFAFTSTLVTLFDRELANNQREANPKTWTFFHAGPRIAAARSSLGGLNLMHKESAFASNEA